MSSGGRRTFPNIPLQENLETKSSANTIMYCMHDISWRRSQANSRFWGRLDARKADPRIRVSSKQKFQQAKVPLPRRMRLNEKGAMLLQGNLPKTCRMNPILPVGVQMQSGAQKCTNEQRRCQESYEARSSDRKQCHLLTLPQMRDSVGWREGWG
jgi:hypothetical protein